VWNTNDEPSGILSRSKIAEDKDNKKEEKAEWDGISDA
jgi:hypothetical protein